MVIHTASISEFRYNRRVFYLGIEVMIKIGQINKLEVTKTVDFGVFLDGGDYGSILLPSRFVPEGTAVGEALDVFIYLDSENEVVASTETPKAQVGQFGLMNVIGTNSIGAFVDWDIAKKDLLVPFSEQRGRLEEGQNILVYVYIDKASSRIVGTTRFNKWLDNTPANYERGQQVDILIAERTDLGYKAVINGEHWGLIFHSDVFGKLFIGKQLKAFIAEMREDGKISLSLQRPGVARMDDLSEKVIATLEKKEGFLPLTDKSSPDAIFTEFRTSKGTFKKTIGGLYKAGKITIEKDGIYLVAAKSE